MDYLNETMESFNQYISNIPNGANYIANKLRAKELKSAFMAIKDFSEGITWISEASQLLELNGVGVEFNIEKIQTYLEEINSGLEKQDYVLVADMFEYEIAPFFLEVPLVNN